MQKTKQIQKCQWLNQKGEPCSWKSLSIDKLYCKAHSIYEGIYIKEDIPNLKKCSGCKNLFLPEGEYKNCKACKERGKKNNEKVKNTHTKCIAINSKKESCTFKACEENDYCGKHQSYKKWKDLIDAGNNVCKNWIRGCFAIIDDNIKACRECRNKEQANENKNNLVKKNKAIEFNEITDDLKMCLSCNKKIKTENLTNNKCLECYEAYKKSAITRVRNPLERKLTYIKKSAKSRNIEWLLSNEFAIKLLNQKCNYCNKLIGYNGIDRVDSNDSYNEKNCVSCCKKCNYLKQTSTVSDFISKIKYLLKVNYLIDENETENYDEMKTIFICGENAYYPKFIYYSKKRNIHNEISKNMYNNMIEEPCHYCKNTFTEGARGIDRIDSTKGYLIGNIVPCCYSCNVMKNILSVEDFFNQLKKIYKFYVLKINDSDEEISLREKILTLCKNIKPFEHEKFYHDDEYYQNLVYNDMDINKVKQIQIELEFVETKKQQDIWNYYRRNVSSLKKIKNAKLIGRQIYVLVKDKLSLKYLGIMSFSSDMYSLDERDKYIGWDFEDKKTRLKYIMNMSTCVPLQPFGFNFNGGKLLASLAFSKEISDYFQKKYNEPLLGITTTSIYGKSIQYDRLKQLKFLGYTRGNSVQMVPSEVTKLCNEYLKIEFNYNYNLSKKFIILQKTFDELNISKEDILTSNPKGVYFGFTCDARQFLKRLTDEIPKISKQQNMNDIFIWWINKWAGQRFNHLVNTNRLKINDE